MSSSIPYRYVGAKFERERYEQVDKVAQWLYEVDNAPDETEFRSKLKSFWKRTRIHAVVKYAVAESKYFLSRLASRLTPDATPPESDHSEEKTAGRATEQVNFLEDVSASPVASSDLAPVSTFNHPTSLENRPLNSPTPSPFPTLKLAKLETANHPTVDDALYGAENANERTFSAFRYKEGELGKQQDFPEIEVGVVSARVKWLKPLLSGERETVQALEMHDVCELALNMGGGKVDQSPNDTESDDASAFDDSPRFFKHRLPKEEPEPWVEPGTVAKGAMWLQPVFSGEKRARSGDSEHGNLRSPTRISHGMFR